MIVPNCLQLWPRVHLNRGFFATLDLMQNPLGQPQDTGGHPAGHVNPHDNVSIL